jgi:hypothetical protein
MNAGSIQKLVGVPVRDSYGRHLGYAVGFSIDTSGDVRSIGVDEGNGRFNEYPSTRFVSDKDGFIVQPAWKLESEAFAKEVEMVKKRMQALRDLLKDGEIDKELYGKMYQQYDGKLGKIQESSVRFADAIRHRVGELNMQEDVLDEFLVNVKMYSKSGEIDEPTFKSVLEYSNAMKARDAHEREELNRVLSMISANLGAEVKAKPKPIPDNEPMNIKPAIGQPQGA